MTYPNYNEFWYILACDINRHSAVKCVYIIFQITSLSLAFVVIVPCRPADHILKSLHWLKVPERIEYKIISTTYKLLQFSSPQYLRDTISIQPSRSTRSSDLITLLRPPVQSRLRITNRSFRHTAPQLWNKLPHSLRVPSVWFISQLLYVLRLQPWTCCQPVSWCVPFSAQDLSLFQIFSSLVPPLPRADYLVNELACC